VKAPAYEQPDYDLNQTIYPTNKGKSKGREANQGETNDDY